MWKQINGFGVYDSNYEVNTNGDVRHMATKKILKRRYSYGYCYYRLYYDGKPKDIRAHRLVMLTHNPSSDKDLIINHIDGDKGNPNISNLEWVTYSDNNNHAVMNGLLPSGEKHVWSTLTEAEATEIITLLKEGKSMSYIRGLNVKYTKSIVEKMKSGQRWKYLQHKLNLETCNDYSERK